VKNRWRIVHGYLQGQAMNTIGPASDTGPMLDVRLLAAADQ
jgi:hypothetical protein